MTRKKLIRASLGALTAALASLGQTTSGARKGSAEKGNEIFDEQCASCHSAYSPDRKRGPGLESLYAKEKLESNGKPVTDPNVLEIIEKGGKGMPRSKRGSAQTTKPT